MEGHHHAPSAPTDLRTRRALVWALGLNAAFLVVEATIGLWTGSLALLSDAAHMVSDVAALSVALAASYLAVRAADPQRSFGFRRAEVLGALINGLAMLLVVGLIVKEAVVRLTSGGPELSAWPVLVAGVVGLVINLGSAWWLARGDRHNLNVRGALIHMLADALGSVGAIVAAIGVWLGWAAADAWIALAVAALVLWSTGRLLRDSVRVLMEFAPDGVQAEPIGAALSGIEGVAGVHELHLWTLDGREPLLTAHLVRTQGVRTDPLLGRARALLAERFEIRHATLQVERVGVCADTCCALGYAHARKE
jgi:cobalt-zinc-cadmium efflux system protein